MTWVVLRVLPASGHRPARVPFLPPLEAIHPARLRFPFRRHDPATLPTNRDLRLSPVLMDPWWARVCSVLPSSVPLESTESGWTARGRRRTAARRRSRTTLVREVTILLRGMIPPG